MKKRGLAGMAGALLAGCAPAPSIDVLGAYFPSWLFCLIAAAGLTVMVHLIQIKWQLGRWLTPMAVVYPVLLTLFSLAIWLIFFPH